MLIKRILAPLAMLLTMVGLSATSHGQHGQIESTGSAIYEANRNTDLEQTFSAYGDFDSDLQFFRPLDYADFTPEQEERNGLFFAYDRMFMLISAPQKLQPFVADFGDPQSAANFESNLVGNRYDTGYMSKQDSGFTVTAMNTKGVALSGVVNPNLNLLTTAVPLGQTPSVNVTSFLSIEINKTFRQRMKHGGYFEPYFGLRLMHLKDEFLQDTLPVGQVAERFEQRVQNRMYGGQIGSRAYHRTGRWTMSGNLSLSASYNDQSYNVTDQIDLQNNSFVYFDMTQDYSTFVPMTELRLDMSYLLTSDISLRFGLEGMYFIKGINRVITNGSFDNPNSLNFGGVNNPLFPAPSDVYAFNDQRLWMWGATVGIEWRR